MRPGLPALEASSSPPTEVLSLEEAYARFGEEAVKQTLRHDAWRRGDLSFLLHEGQEALIEAFKASTAFITCWAIARRYGKTHAALVLASEVCLGKPNARVPYLASTATSLRQFVDDILFKIFETAPEDLRPVIVGSEARFTNGSVIVFQGCEDRQKADRLRGGAADLVVVDEAAFIDVLDYVVGSVLTPQLMKTGGRMLVCSSPPESIAHPFKTYCDAAKKTRSYYHRSVLDAPRSHLSLDDIEKFKAGSGGSNSIVWRREGLAEFLTNPDKAIVPEFIEGQHEVVVAWPRPQHFDRYVIGDIGFSQHLTAVLFGFFDFLTAKIVIEDEVFLRRANSSEIQSSVLAKEIELWGPVTPPFARHTRRIDAMPITRADLSRLQPRDDPGRNVIWLPVRNAEKRAAVNALRLAVQNRELVIHPRCLDLISHLERGTWNGPGTDFAETPAEGHFDGIAALMYFVRHVDRARNPTPPLWHSSSNAHVPNGYRLPPAAYSDDAAARAQRLRDALSPRKQRR